jgi:hypothetical protein
MHIVRLQLAMATYAGYQHVLNPDSLHQRLIVCLRPVSVTYGRFSNQPFTFLDN